MLPISLAILYLILLLFTMLISKKFELYDKPNARKIHTCLNNFYKKHIFVKILKFNSLLNTNDVINTNYCNISVCKSRYSNKIILLSAIDNLIKGGAGQGVQNMNILYNFNINEGLK